MTEPNVLGPLSWTGITARLRSAGCVFAEQEAELLLTAAAESGDLAKMVARRVDGHPLEQVVGWAEFCGLRIAVDDGVFIPRRRTEFLARRAVGLAAEAAAAVTAAATAAVTTGAAADQVAEPGNPPVVVVDLCCGSGALGAVVASTVSGVELHAADIDRAAVRCAERNLAPLGGNVYQGDLFGPLPIRLGGQVRVLLANAPYVPSAEIVFMPAEARLHEAGVALDGGSDGLAVLARVVAGAGRWLAPAGHLLMESSRRQAPLLLDRVRRAGMIGTIEQDDDLDATVVIGRRAP